MAYTKTIWLKSTGAARNVDVGFVSDRIDAINHTEYGTDSKKVVHHWNKEMTAGYALTDLAEDTSINKVITSANGFTPYNATDVTTNQATVSGASAASPCVITATAHGFGAAGDVFKVKLKDIVGMTEINNVIYSATIVDANSFSLKTLQGNNLDSSAFTAYSSGGVALALDLVVENEGVAGVTLGTVIVGAAASWIELQCHLDDDFVNIG